VVSHGGGGRFALGNEMITAERISQEGSAWSALSDNFSSNSAVYLFGCNVVDGSGRGQALLDGLSSLTGSTVFASNDLTGVGGDWVLESASAGADLQLATPDSRMLVALAGFEGSLANTPPVVVVPGTQSVNEDLVLAVNGVSVSDPDVPLALESTRVVEVTLNVTNLTGTTVSDGLLTLGQNVGLTFTPSAVGVVSDGIADSQMSFLGSITDVNAALASLNFQGATNFNGDLQVQVSVNDRGNIDTAISIAVDPNQIGVPIITSTAFGITVVAVNDAPVNTVPAGVQNAIEDTPLVFAGSVIQVSDVDANGAPLQVTLAATNGTVSLASLTGLTLVNGTGSADSSVTVTGSAAAINTALNGVNFNATPNFVGAATLTLTTSDQNAGAQGLGGAGITTNVIDIGVAGVNDAPVNSLPAVALNVVEDTPLVMTVAGGTAVQVSDVELGTAGIMQVSLLVDSGTLSLAQVNGLTFTAGSAVLGAANPSMTFSGSVTDVNAALDGLTYTPVANFNGAVNLQISSNDLNAAGAQGSGGALTTLNNLALNVSAVNDAPIYTLPAAVQNVAEEGSVLFSVANNNAIVVSDADAGVNPLLVTLSAADGTLTLATTAGLTLITGNGTADSSVTFSGSATAINTALDGLLFNAATNFTGNSQIVLTVNDQNNGNQGSGGALSGNGVVNLAVSAINDAPVNTLPLGQTTNEDQPLVFSNATGNAVQVSDVDIAAAPMQVTLSASSGTLTLAQLNGLTFQGGTGIDNASMTFTGTVVDINLALNGLQFSPLANFSGAASLQVISNDLNAGAQGLGGALSASSTVAITVNAVNDAPVLTLPAAQTVLEDGVLPLGGVQVSDVDVGAGVMTVSLTLGDQQTVANGSLNLASSTGLVFAAGSSATGSTITFDGSLADINSALATLSYSANPNFNGTERLNVVVSDGGNAGSGGILSATGLVDIAITAVNDAPILTVPGAQVVNEDTDLPISGISINDVDAGNGRVAVPL
ncbi:MAG: DUF4347 domain-containing protein, partial [Gammaproteobacteria bacterium]|nr:DUF4347 domain-containing protein [Gammaproteobacteria bacterium]